MSVPSGAARRCSGGDSCVNWLGGAIRIRYVVSRLETVRWRTLILAPSSSWVNPSSRRRCRMEFPSCKRVRAMVSLCVLSGFRLRFLLFRRFFAYRTRVIGGCINKGPRGMCLHSFLSLGHVNHGRDGKGHGSNHGQDKTIF